MLKNQTYCLCVFLFFIITCIKNIHAGFEDVNHWNLINQAELDEALRIQHNTGRAKNVILFVGDGMGPATVTAARVYGQTETGRQHFEQFPHVGILKTYCADRIVPDSASTATALFTGVKVNMKTGGVDTSVKIGDCEHSLNKSTHLKSIIDWAQEAGKSTGFVTTARVTHATPMALFAHVPDRTWECEAKMPTNTKCKDIARQLVEDEPGKNINVIMGGGRQTLQTGVPSKPGDQVDVWACNRKDGKDLIKAWTDDKTDRKLNHAVLYNNKDLEKLDVDKTDYVLGIFSNGHMVYEHNRNKQLDGSPSLSNMTEAAIKVLRKNKNGFLLVVEGGMIDFAHHRGHARFALDETVAMDNAVFLTQQLMADKASETLIIVTADHSHSLSITGYPVRGKGILGIAMNSYTDKIPFTTLNYATGGQNNFQYKAVNGTVVRDDPSLNKTDDFNYSQQSGILHNEVTHSGNDVYVYATGPMAHLFHSLHEQTYVARVIAYAAKIGPDREKSIASGLYVTNVTFVVVVFTIIWKFI